MVIKNCFIRITGSIAQETANRGCWRINGSGGKDGYARTKRNSARYGLASGSNENNGKCDQFTAAKISRGDYDERGGRTECFRNSGKFRTYGTDGKNEIISRTYYAAKTDWKRAWLKYV